MWMYIPILSTLKRVLHFGSTIGRSVGGKTQPTSRLWEQLDAATHRHQITWHWVKGHSDHPENDRVDALAREAIDRLLSSEVK